MPAALQFKLGVEQKARASSVPPEGKMEPREPYCPPELRKINREQAALILLGRAWDGDANAKKLLEDCADVLFPAPAAKKGPAEDK